MTNQLEKIREIKRNRDKVSRMIGLTPYFEAGKFFLPDPEVERVGWLEPFLEEYRSFPRGVHGDTLDALHCAVEAADLRNPYGGGFFFGGP